MLVGYLISGLGSPMALTGTLQNPPTNFWGLPETSRPSGGLRKADSIGPVENVVCLFWN